MNNFVKHCLDNGGVIKPLIIPSKLTNGTGLFNPTIFIDDDGRIIANIRHCQYTLYHSEKRVYEHQWGPLLYLNPDNDSTLTTTNYFCALDENLDTENILKVDTSLLDKKPLWQFVGLEDARLVKWDGKYYMTGVRRDLDTIGTGRMDLSEIEITENTVREVARYRIPVPANAHSYCEKNWMPIVDLPFHYVKWTNPTQVVRCDISNAKPNDDSGPHGSPNVTCESLFVGGRSEDVKHDLRGGSQVISYKGGYLALNHVTYLYRSPAGRKDATYRHQFTYWDKNWNVIKRSAIFDFMDAKIEFSCGMCNYGDDYLITFGLQDNAAYVLKLSDKVLEDFINA